MVDRKIILVIVAVFILIIWSESRTYNKKIEEAYQEGYNAAVEEYK